MSSVSLNYGYVEASEPKLWRAVYNINYVVSDDPLESPPPSCTYTGVTYSLLYAFRDWLSEYVRTRSLALSGLRNEYNDTLNNYDKLLSQCIVLGNAESVCRAQLDSYLTDRKTKIERLEAVLSKVNEDIGKLDEFIRSITPPPYQPPPPQPPPPVFAGETKPEEVLPPEIVRILRQPPPQLTEAEVVEWFKQKVAELKPAVEEVLGKPPEEAEVAPAPEAPPEEKPPEKPPEERPTAPAPPPAPALPLGLLALLALLLAETK